MGIFDQRQIFDFFFGFFWILDFFFKMSIFHSGRGMCSSGGQNFNINPLKPIVFLLRAKQQIDVAIWSQLLTKCVVMLSWSVIGEQPEREVPRKNLRRLRLLLGLDFYGSKLGLYFYFI